MSIRVAREGRCILVLAAWVMGCGQRVEGLMDARDGNGSDGADGAEVADGAAEARVDVRAEDARDAAFDASTDAEDASTDAEDASTDGGREAGSDGGGVADAGCGPPADASVRPETNQSCRGPNGAPSEHCREVWLCGGPTQFGQGGGVVFHRSSLEPIPMRACEIGTIHVQPGYIDAYEVSVARYRAWVRAGMPYANSSTYWFNGHRGSTPGYREYWVPDRLIDLATGERNASPQPDLCTWRDSPGPNDSLPVNCVNIEAAVNFCWWEGKHLVTEAAWDYAARNGALRTRRPFDAPDGFDPCLYGDVFRAGRCARGGGLSPIDAFPRGASQSPDGIFGLWGGVRELVLAATFQYCDLEPLLDGAMGQASRGLSAFDEGVEASAFDASATRETRGFILLREQGFRCARWVPEPRETRVPGTR